VGDCEGRLYVYDVAPEVCPSLHSFTHVTCLTLCACAL
jgi:hypothetical protein